MVRLESWFSWRGEVGEEEEEEDDDGGESAE